MKPITTTKPVDLIPPGTFHGDDFDFVPTGTFH